MGNSRDKNDYSCEYGWIDNGQEKHPTRFELIRTVGDVFFLREAPENKGDEIHHNVAHFLADEQADKIRAEGKSVNTHFHLYDKEKGVWKAYQFVVHKEWTDGFVYRELDHCPQYLLEKTYGLSLSRSGKEFIEQSYKDIAFMKERLRAERIEITVDRVFGNRETREKAKEAYAEYKDKKAVLQGLEKALDSYLSLRGKKMSRELDAWQANKRIENYTAKMKEIMHGRAQSQEKERQQDKERKR